MTERHRLEGLTYFFPALNEEAHIEPLVERARSALTPLTEHLEIIVVDDGSSDRTGEIADALAARLDTVRAVHHERPHGYGGAVRAGIRAATQPFIFFTDGDRQFDPADLVMLLPELERADAVIAYRRKRSDPISRRFIAWCYNRLIAALFGLRVRDVDCAFKLFRREVFDAVPLNRIHSDGVFFSAELLIRMHEAGLRTPQVGVPHHARSWGVAKGAPPKAILRAIRDLLWLRLRLWLERARAATGRPSARAGG